METSTKTAARTRKPVQRGLSPERSILKKSIIIVVALFVLALIDAQYGMFSALHSKAQSKGKWQAVFLTNGQVYFGHLSPFGMKFLKLDNVYYIRTVEVPMTVAPTLDEEGNSVPQQAQYEKRNEIVKITEDTHGPEDTLYLPKQQILFWQTLRHDSEVVRLISTARK